MNTAAQRRSFGEQLRDWRQRRHLSQLDLASQVEISTRHLSFVETGRSQPSRAMVLRLAERLAVPLRERNALLISAGFAPMYAMHALSDPSMSAARAAVDLILTGHEPYPALLVDRHWTLVAANRIVVPLLEGVDPRLLEPPMNMLRVTLHPDGLAPRIVNLAQWRSHIIARVQRDFELTADAELGGLLTELRGYPERAGDSSAGSGLDFGGVLVPMKLQSPAGVLTLFSTSTVFGTAIEVTLSELVLEAFYPADESTANVLRQVASSLTGDASSCATIAGERYRHAASHDV